MKRKTTIWISPLIIMGVLLILASSCKKDDDNNDKPAQGSGIIFNPNKSYGSVADIDGNTYKTITIGTQTWMAENLRATKYNDGTAIPLVSDDSEWGNLNTPGYCWYNNDAATFKNTRGALYNWHVVKTGKLAPVGWHVPSDEEWAILITFLGGVNGAGGKMKETGTSHWLSPNTGATNETGFTALPGGYRSKLGFTYNSNYFVSWTSVEDYTDVIFAYHASMHYDNEEVEISITAKWYGLSVRCIKDVK
jgi:uncharacterized protein (TIGR02145 family)